MKTLFLGIAVSLGLTAFGQDVAFKLTLDAGHGGKDAGMTFGKTNEGALTLQFQNKLAKHLLEQAPVEITKTRESDIYIDLKDRASIVSDKADLLVTIHLNQTKEESPYISILFPETGDFQIKSREASSVIMEHLHRTGYAIKNSKPANLYMLNHVQCPAICFEFYLPEKQNLSEDELNSLTHTLAEAILEIARKEGKL